MLFADLKLRPEAEQVVKEHTNPSNTDLGKALFQETDVTEWKHLERMFSVAEARFGTIDIVVPGAGVYEPVSAPYCFQLYPKSDLPLRIGPVFGILQKARNQ